MNFDNHEKRTVAYRFRVENGLQILFTQYKTGFTVTLTVFSLFFLSLSFGLSSCCLLVQSFSPFYLLGVQLCSISLGHHVHFIRSNLYWLYSGRQWGFCAGWFTPVIFNITMYKPLPQNSLSLFSFFFFLFGWTDLILII